DLQHGADESDDAPAETRKSNSLMTGVITLFILGSLAVTVFVLYYSLNTGRRITRVEALPVDALAQYPEFVEKTKSENLEILDRLSAVEKSLVINEGRLDQSDEQTSAIKAALDQNRDRMEEFDKRIRVLSDTLAAQQKSASELKRKIAQSNAASHKLMPPADVQLYSVRSFGNVPAVRLTARSGEVSPLLLAGDVWNGWRFIRLDDNRAVFQTGGREQVLSL